MKKISFKLALPFYFLSCFITQKVDAQDLLAGEISAKYISGLTYEATVIIYAKDTTINRDSIVIDWGDGMKDTLPKNSEIKSNDLRILTYKGTHTYPGEAIYSITYSGNYRVQGIVNVPSSQFTALQFEHLILISSSVINNSSVQFLSPPYDIGISGEVYSYWPGANEPDGDSITYEIALPFGSGWWIPSGMSIDAITGNFMWNSPQQTGYYGIGLVVKEWRNNLVISSTQREMLINIDSAITAIDGHTNENNECMIHPNPTTGKCTITNLPRQASNITIYNIFGQQIHLSTNPPITNAPITVDLSVQPNGIYFLIAGINGQRQAMKIIKM